MANTCFYGPKNQLRSKFISTKTNLHKTLIRRMVLQGSECWVLNKTEEGLLIFERKILRRIFGPIKENNCWRIPYNHEIYQKFSKPNIIKLVRASRIRWLGCNNRYKYKFSTKKITFLRLEGRRLRGRPADRQLDGVEKDLKAIGVMQWTDIAQDRVRWGKALRDSLALQQAVVSKFYG